MTTDADAVLEPSEPGLDVWPGPVIGHTVPFRDRSVTVGAWLRRFPGFASNSCPSGMGIESYCPTGPTSARVVCNAVQRDPASELARSGILGLPHETTEFFVPILIVDAVNGRHR